MTEKLHIIITGRRNNGKSSLINALTGQQTAIVSPVAGTTTDPVKKSYEIPGFASVVFIDTAGIDDTGELGLQRIKKTYEQFPRADAAILVITDNRFGTEETELVRKFRMLGLPFLIVHNKADIAPLSPELEKKLREKYSMPVVDFSVRQPETIPVLLEQLRKITPVSSPVSLLEGIAEAGNTVLLVTPIDAEAPEGRLILPQVKTLRALLDKRCTGIVLQPEEITGFLAKTSIIPDLVITDSQVFGQVAALLPSGIPLTSFSILLARQKGCFREYLGGAESIQRLKDKDRILVLESCSHHFSCEDIGRVKIPALLRKYTGKDLVFEFIAGLDPVGESPDRYALVLQCGGCMITATQLRQRLRPFIEAGIPVCNYGMALACCNGIFERAIEIFRKTGGKISSHTPAE